MKADIVEVLIVVFGIIGILGCSAMAWQADMRNTEFNKLSSQCIADRVNTKDICEAEAYLKVYK